VVRNQESDRVHDWEHRAGRSDHIGAAAAALIGGTKSGDRGGDPRLRGGRLCVPGRSVSLVARRHGIAPNQLFTWRRLYASGALSAVRAGEEVMAASGYRALQHQVRELQRLLGKKTLKNEILREALDLARPKKRLLRTSSPARDDTP